MILFADRACPFAHRVRALLEHLGREVQCFEAEVGQSPPGVYAYSRSGRLPLLVDDDVKVTESRVMLEHLVDRFAPAGAWPDDVLDRARHRLAMATVDAFFVPKLLQPADARIDPTQLHEALDDLQAATSRQPPGPSLLAFHVAPIWLRFRWWQPTGHVVAAIEARPALRTWLDAAADLEPIHRTAPDHTTQRETLLRARTAGLLPAAP